jgi:hypothetical protein
VGRPERRACEIPPCAAKSTSKRPQPAAGNGARGPPDLIETRPVESTLLVAESGCTPGRSVHFHVEEIRQDRHFHDDSSMSIRPSTSIAAFHFFSRSRSKACVRRRRGAATRPNASPRAYIFRMPLCLTGGHGAAIDCRRERSPVRFECYAQRRPRQRCGSCMSHLGTLSFPNLRAIRSRTLVLR